MTNVSIKEKSQFYEKLRQSVRSVCSQFPNSYWRELGADLVYLDFL
ncbi:hypothetical protein BAOM_2193 [Peribacillus asahii]|uniref:Uncharacterized protein n=1 Tax=Peribacillus asahii TaxID=228899 RepID=A0A3Q9RMC5_9BACI|nr:hypothetical protein BAOM_2193 [Peribacillus asahii]